MKKCEVHKINEHVRNFGKTSRIFSTSVEEMRTFFNDESLQVGGYICKVEYGRFTNREKSTSGYTRLDNTSADTSKYNYLTYVSISRWRKMEKGGSGSIS